MNKRVEVFWPVSVLNRLKELTRLFSYLDVYIIIVVEITADGDINDDSLIS